MPYRVVQYQSKAEPIPLGAAERTTPDKWLGESPDLPVRRGFSTALISAIAFVPYISAATPTPVYVNSQCSEPTRVEHVQYQAKAEPVLVETPAGETVTVDKWAVNTEQAQRLVKRTPQESFFAESLHTVPVSVIVPLYVSAQSSEPTQVLHFQYQTKAEPLVTTAAPPETVTSDKWSTAWPQPTFRPRRLVQYERLNTIAGQIDDGLPPLHWRAEGIDPIRLRNRAQFEFPEVIAAAPETITLDKWLAVDSLVSPRKNHQYIYPSYVAGREGEAVAPTPYDWQRDTDIPRRLLVRGLIVQPAIDLAGAERETLDKWQPLTNQPRFDIKRWQWLYPPLAIDSQFYLIPPAEIIRLDKWDRQYPDVIFRTKRLSDYTHFSIDSTLGAERVSLDKWAQEQPRPRVQRRIPITSAPDLLLVTVPESVTLDKWITETQIQQRMRRLTQFEINEPLVVTAELLPQLFEAVAELVHSRPRALILPTPDLFPISLPQLFDALAEPSRAQKRAQILPAPELLLDVPFTDWYALAENALPQWRRMRLLLEGANMVRLPDPVPPDVRIHHGPRGASVPTRSTDASISTSIRSAEIKRR